MSQDRKRIQIQHKIDIFQIELANSFFPAERLEFPDFSLKKTLSFRLRFDPKKHFFNDR